MFFRNFVIGCCWIFIVIFFFLNVFVWYICVNDVDVIGVSSNFANVFSIFNSVFFANVFWFFLNGCCVVLFISVCSMIWKGFGVIGCVVRCCLVLMYIFFSVRAYVKNCLFIARYKICFDVCCLFLFVFVLSVCICVWCLW